MVSSNINYQNLLSERERDLEDRNEELEAQQEELTAAVEALIEKNMRLESTLERLNTLNAEIDQIVYRSSHDLKSPITTLEGLFSLISADGANIEQYLEKAKQTTNDMKHILVMLVRYSNTLVSTTFYEKVKLSDFVEQLMEEVVHIHGYQHVKLNVKTLSETWYGDRAKLQLILYNLIKNSIDFRSDKNPRVDLYIQIKNNMLRAQISDNGIGIANEIQQQVFNMFYRGNNQSKGSGLGLYLSKRTVEILGGKINLVSSVGVGTTITVELPNNNKAD